MPESEESRVKMKTLKDAQVGDECAVVEWMASPNGSDDDQLTPSRTGVRASRQHRPADQSPDFRQPCYPRSAG